MPILNVIIQKPVVVAVEGIDDRLLLDYLCHNWVLSNIQFISLSETPSFDNVSAIINMPGFHQTVKAFGIIRDADERYQSAKDSVEDILRRLALPIKTSYFIFPDNKNNGMLETLLMQVSSTDVDRTQCVDGFITCLTNKSIRIPNHRKDKAKIYAYLSAFDEPGKRIGEAASGGYWDHTNKVFNNLKQFLSDLAK